MISNKELELAWNFVEKTDRNIFLTGKAGTGKTTFLHKIKNESLKRLVVVAPTGVAAINAKGVTIHSFFQMPFGPIIPDGSLMQNTRGDFKMKFSRQKIDIIRSLDLLVIDEISMVRADLLDGINQVLRRYKNRNKVFGGVQVLMIGDLQQLSPVVKPQEWELLKPYYDNAYFFSSITFQKSNAISIELKHIYRQDNEQFIGILNEIRNDNLSPASIAVLNKRYDPNFVPTIDDGYITLTTHNNRADNMNELELKKLDSKSYFYTAKVEGKFNEYAYPTHEKLALKVGAQVMFIKNDSSQEKQYYNGKVGTIIELDQDEITIHCPDDDFDIVATPEVWENVTYSIDQTTKAISEEIAGSFSQMPLRLAWAITIHKSQGLTFEKAIIDANASFAHGQTYVALSRCKSLEGIVLKSPIDERSIINDNRVATFTKDVEENHPDEKVLSSSRKTYQLNLIEELFDYQELLYPIKRLTDIYYNHKTSLEGNILVPLTTIKENGIQELIKIGMNFQQQLLALSTEILDLEKDDKIQERIKKAVTYFIGHTKENIITPYNEWTYSTDNQAIKKDISKQVKLFEDRLSVKQDCLKGLMDGFNTTKYLELRAKAILQKSEVPKRKSEQIDTTEHPILFEKLRSLRFDLAAEEDVAHYQIFTQKALYEMCAYFPVVDTQLRAINGMGKVRVEKYGKNILDIIYKYVQKNELTPREVEEIKSKKPAKGGTQMESLEMFKKGMTITEIAEKRGFVYSTIEGHLIKFIPTGEIKIEDIIPKEKYEELKKLIASTKFEGLTDLKNKLDDKFSYSELRLVLKDYLDSKKA